MVFDVGRVLTRPVELAGYRLPAGVMVAPGIGLVHASPEQYPNPDRFDPDRMLGAALGPTTWLPFGGGNRRCLGATFAMAEIRVVLREVLRRVELRTTTAKGEGQKVKHVVLVPHRGARICIQATRDIVTALPATVRDAQLPDCDRERSILDSLNSRVSESGCARPDFRIPPRCSAQPPT